MSNILKVRNPCVVEVLTWENDVVEVTRVCISNRMLIRVPPSKAEVKSAHESRLSVDEAQLLMMCPIKNYIITHTVNTLQSINGQG